MINNNNNKNRMFKIMNEIEAEFDCRITKAIVSDGQPVEFGMALFEVEKI